MNYWVCKGKASNEFKSALKPGETARWHTKKPPKRLSLGDLVFLWESSPHRHLVGLGEILNPDAGLDRDGERVFEQKYLTKRFPSPYGIEELRGVPIVNTAAFLKVGPSTVLTELNSEQAEILLTLLAQRNPTEVPRHLLPESLNPIVEAAWALTAKEGGKKLFIHYVRERSTRLTRTKREVVLASTGRLACEVCDFDFARCYGSLGEGFCEVHHTRPLGKLEAETETSIDDLAIVCSNCHRMIHQGEMLWSIADLRAILQR